MKWTAPLAALLVSCTASVPATNPFDPQTPPAQQARGTVRGVVDPAVVPGGGETVRLHGTGTSEATTVADATGAFVFSDVEPGTYSLELRVLGFETLYLLGLSVQAGQAVNLGTLVPVDNRPTQAASVALDAVNPASLPGTLSCNPAVANPCQVTVTLSADDNPTQLQLSGDPTFTGATWTPVPAGAQPWVVPFTMPSGPDGSTWLFVRFRDAAGNVSAPFLGEILLKSSPPTGTALAFPSLASDAGGTSYTNQLPLSIATQASGATRMRVSCDVTQPLAGRPWVPYNTSQTCVLVAGDGTKSIAADFMDDAGNAAPTATASVWLQQTPPAAPALTISAAGGAPGSRTLVTGPSTATTSSASFVVQVAPAASAGALFARLEAWSSFGYPATVAADARSVTFSLFPGSPVTNASNQLSVRVVDKAGNAGPASSVTIAQEQAVGALPPSGLSLFTRPGSVQVSWTASQSAYATGYLLAYGPTSGYGGAGADQGVSPVQVGNPCDASGACRYVLTGLSNFEPEYLRLTTLSALQSGQSLAGGPVTPQPVSLTAVGALSFGAFPAYAVAVADDRAYVVVSNGLQIVDLSNPAAPALLGKAAFAASIPAGASSGIELRWPYAYVGGPDGFYVLDVSNEALPAVVGKFTTPRPVVGVALRWPYAYLNVNGTGNATSGANAAQLTILDVTTAATPAQVGTLASPSYGSTPSQGAIAILGNTVWFGTGTNSNIHAADVTNPAAPAWITGADLFYLGQTNEIAVDPGFRRLVFSKDQNGGLHVIDYSTPAAKSVLATVPGLPSGRMAVAGSDVLVVGGTQLEVLDASDPTSIRLAGTVTLPLQVGAAYALAVTGSTVVVVGSGGLAILSSSHLQYPQARGQAQSLGVLGGGSRIELRTRTAMVPGNGIALYDVGNPAAPRMVASNYGIFYTGNDYGLGSSSMNYGSGLATAGDLLFNAFATDCNSGAGLVTYRLGTYQGTCPGPGCVPCAVARIALPQLQIPAGCFPSPNYYGLATHGAYLFAAKGGATRAIDVYRLADFNANAACAYGNPIAAGPAAAATFPLSQDPRDIAVHRNYGFVAETTGFEILDLTNPLAIPPSLVLHTGEAGVRALSVRLAACTGGPCYRIFLAGSAGLRAFSWTPGSVTVVDEGTLGSLGASASLLLSPGMLVQGQASTGGLGFYDATPAFPLFQSYSTPQPSGGVQAMGAAGRYVYANDNGAFVVQELQ